jgi:P pilus assembly chaperone PapD
MLRPSAAAGALLLLGVAALPAQIVLSPSVVLLSDAERVSSLSVRNVSGTAQEVSLSFRFGYARSDAVGKMTVLYGDSAVAERHSMTDWLRAYPRQFVLPAGAVQVVRLIGQPPGGLEDAVYWTRLAVGAQPQSPPVDSLSAAVSTRITLRIEQVIPVFFRRGLPDTRVTIGAASLHADSVGTYLLVPLAQTGSAPFLGAIGLTVRDADGRAVHEVSVPVTVYFEAVYRVLLPAGALQPGTTYTAEISASSQRADVPPGRVPVIEPVSSRFAYTPP